MLLIERNALCMAHLQTVSTALEHGEIFATCRIHSFGKDMGISNDATTVAHCESSPSKLGWRPAGGFVGAHSDNGGLDALDCIGKACMGSRTRDQQGKQDERGGSQAYSQYSQRHGIEPCIDKPASKRL
jgi:hypothetical protein